MLFRGKPRKSTKAQVVVPRFQRRGFRKRMHGISAGTVHADIMISGCSDVAGCVWMYVGIWMCMDVYGCTDGDKEPGSGTEGGIEL